MKRSVLIRVSPEFKKKMKMKAVEENKTIIQLSRELAKDEKKTKGFFLRF